MSENKSSNINKMVSFSLSFFSKPEDSLGDISIISNKTIFHEISKF